MQRKKKGMSLDNRMGMFREEMWVLNILVIGTVCAGWTEMTRGNFVETSLKLH